MLKIQLKKDQQAFFTSDTHMFHKNLCSATTEWRRKVTLDNGEIIKVVPDNVRKFDSLEEMNNTIVTNINNTVGEDDILIHLGDWSFGGFDRIREFRDMIKCKNIYLITGNHDSHIVKNKDNIRSIFTGVHEYYTQLDLRVGERVRYDMILCHYPICSWENMAKGYLHLFGHVHLPPNVKIREGRAMDCGMDGNNLTPYSLTEIVYIMKQQPIKHISLPRDHHEERFVNV